MLIQTEQTPNPATLKFLPGRSVLESGTAYFPDVEAAGRSPLAQRLFAVTGVTEVFFGADRAALGRQVPGDRWGSAQFGEEHYGQRKVLGGTDIPVVDTHKSRLIGLCSLCLLHAKGITHNVSEI